MKIKIFKSRFKAVWELLNNADPSLQIFTATEGGLPVEKLMYEGNGFLIIDLTNSDLIDWNIKGRKNGKYASLTEDNLDETQYTIRVKNDGTRS